MNNEIYKDILPFYERWSGSVIAPTASLVKLSGNDTKHLMAVGASFPKGGILDMQDAS